MLLNLLVCSANGAYAEQCDLQGDTAHPAGADVGDDGASSSDESCSEVDKASTAANPTDPRVRILLLVPSASSAEEAGVAPRLIIDECMEWHQLYQDSRCTPSTVFLRALDPSAAVLVSSAFTRRALPRQQEHEDDNLLRYSIEV